MGWPRSFPVAQASARSAGATAKHLLKIVTYNVLASKYAMSGFHNYCDTQFLKWEYRQPKLFEELKTYDSDILCLQEVEQGVFSNELVPWLEKQGFKGWYMARQSGEVVGEPEGVALFYRDSMFRPIAHKSVCFAKCPPPVDPTSSGQVCTDPQGFWDIFKRREEGAIMALLEHTPSGRQLLTACTHLFWNPNFPDVKVLQAATLCQEIRRFMSESGGCHTASSTGAEGSAPDSMDTEGINIPILIGGDFNSLWKKHKSDVFDKVPYGGSIQSGVYTLMSEGILKPDHPDHPYTRRRRSFQGAATCTWEISSVSSCDDDEVPSVPRAHEVLAPSTTADAFRDVDLTSSGLALSSMHKLLFGWEPPLTTKTASFAGCLDYVWLSDGCGMKVLKSLELPYSTPKDPRPKKRSKSKGGSSGGTTKPVHISDPLTQVNFPAMPNKEYPSDHLAMGCILEW